MSNQPDSSEPSPWDLREISTQWSAVSDANFFVLRYADAIRDYLERLLKNEHEVEDVLQQFLVKVIEKGFESASPDRGRFRHYLIRAVRNEVITWQRQQSRRRARSLTELHDHAGIRSEQASSGWDQQWYECILNRCWKHLRQHQKDRPGNLAHSVLAAATEHPELDSTALASLVSQETLQPLASPAFRKQLSRARRIFAEFIIKEVSETLESPTPESVTQELADLGLMPFVSSYLPDSWKATRS